MRLWCEGSTLPVVKKSSCLDLLLMLQTQNCVCRIRTNFLGGQGESPPGPAPDAESFPAAGLILFVINNATPYSAHKQSADSGGDDEVSLSMNLWVIFSSYMEQGTGCCLKRFFTLVLLTSRKLTLTSKFCCSRQLEDKNPTSGHEEMVQKLTPISGANAKS